MRKRISTRSTVEPFVNAAEGVQYGRAVYHVQRCSVIRELLSKQALLFRTLSHGTELHTTLYLFLSQCCRAVQLV